MNAVRDLSGAKQDGPAQPQDLPNPSSTLSAPLLIDNSCNCPSVQPVSLGIPFPASVLREPGSLSLVDDEGKPVLLQTLPLACWPDGSTKWLLLDFMLPASNQGPTTWRLGEGLAETTSELPGEALRIVESGQTLVIDTGVAEFQISRTTLRPFTRVLLHGKDVLAPSLS